MNKKQKCSSLQQKKLILFFFVFIIAFSFLSTAFAYIEVGGINIYHVNKLNPSVNISIVGGKNNITVNYATLYSINDTTIRQTEMYKFDNTYFTANRFPTKISLFEKINYTFPLNLNTDYITYRFFFNITDSNNELIETYTGDKIDFLIEYDNSNPFITTPTDKSIELIGRTVPISIIYFSKTLKYYKIILKDLDDNIINEYNKEELITSNDLNDYINSISIDLNDLNEGMYNLSVEMIDIYGNKNTEYISIYREREPLSMSILSNKKNSSLPYFFDNTLPQYISFFNNTLYSKDTSFTFYLNTNKPSQCYLYTGLIDFVESSQLLNMAGLINFTTTNYQNHSVVLSTTETSKFEVFCISLSKRETVYLSDLFGNPNTVTNLKKYTSDLRILNYQPNSEVSQTPFTGIINTSQKAICNYNYQYLNQNEFFETTNFIFHNKGISTQNGNYNLIYECVNLVGDNVIYEQELTTDLNMLTSVVSYSPHYTGISNTKITLSLSADAECKYSSTQIRESDYTTIPTSHILGVGFMNVFFNYNFQTDGQNRIYVYCLKDSIVSENILEIYYDKNGPQANGIYILNTLFNIKTEYTNKVKDFYVSYDFNSSIGIDYYNITLFDKSGSTIVKKETVHESRYKVRDSVINLSKITVVAVNKYTFKSSQQELLFKLDLTNPMVQIDTTNNVLKLTCTDYESGCYKIMYGLSSSSNSAYCHPNKIYSNNMTIALDEDDNDLCVEAFDKAGNAVKLSHNINNATNGGYNEIDTDEDGMPDYWEDSYGLDKNDPSDADEDLDGDGLTNLEEFELGTDPTKIDTDGDLCSDKYEYDYDYNPLNNSDCNMDNNTLSFNYTQYDEPYTSTNQSGDIPIPSSSGNGYLIALSIFIILAITSGGGYYTYRKGYLDKYLKKLGVQPVTKTKTQNNNKLLNNNNNKQNNKPKTKVESHLNKIKNFMDKKNEELSQTIDKFGNPKDFKNYKIKKDIHSSKSGDEIYDASLNIGTTNDINNEADKFEEFYKTKKELENKEITDNQTNKPKTTFIKKIKNYQSKKNIKK